MLCTRSYADTLTIDTWPCSGPVYIYGISTFSINTLEIRNKRPISQMVYNLIIQIPQRLFCFNFDLNYPISWHICIYYEIPVVMMCAKLWPAEIIKSYVKGIWIFFKIWLVTQKLFVKLVPCGFRFWILSDWNDIKIDTKGDACKIFHYICSMSIISLP